MRRRNQRVQYRKAERQFRYPDSVIYGNPLKDVFRFGSSERQVSKTLVPFFMRLLVAVVISVTSGQIPARASGTASETIVLSASNDSDLEGKNDSGAGAFTRCTEPRPQICTREYRPVCARLQDSGFKTYATGCTSCAEADVVDYRDGTCE